MFGGWIMGKRLQASDSDSSGVSQQTVSYVVYTGGAQQCCYPDRFPEQEPSKFQNQCRTSLRAWPDRAASADSEPKLGGGVTFYQRTGHSVLPRAFEEPLDARKF